MGITINISTTLKALDLADEKVLKGLQEGLGESGAYLEAKMAEKVSEGAIPPPLKPATVKRKGSSRTLVDTGELLGQISSELEPGGLSAKIGVMGPKAEIATHNEYGAPAAGVPERSFIRSTVNAEASKVPEIISRRIKERLG